MFDDTATQAIPLTSSAIGTSNGAPSCGSPAPYGHPVGGQHRLFGATLASRRPRKTPISWWKFISFLGVMGLNVFAADLALGLTEVGGEQSGIWDLDGSPYVVSGGSVIIPEHNTLIIKPGVVVKFNLSYRMEVRGVLKAEGLPQQKIVFTSIKDDSYGEDTNEDGDRTSPDVKDWDGIVFVDSSIDSLCVLRNVLIRCATPPVELSLAAPILDHVFSEQSLIIGPIIPRPPPEPPSPRKAGVRSLILPGWGQIYSDRKVAGVLFFLAEVAAVGGTFWSHQQCDKAVNDYNMDFDVFKAERDRCADLDAVRAKKTETQRRYEDMSTFFKIRDIALYTGIAIWIYNIVDAMMFVPKPPDQESAHKVEENSSRLALHLWGKQPVFKFVICF